MSERGLKLAVRDGLLFVKHLDGLLVELCAVQPYCIDYGHPWTQPFTTESWDSASLLCDAQRCWYVRHRSSGSYYYVSFHQSPPPDLWFSSEDGGLSWMRHGEQMPEGAREAEVIDAIDRIDWS